MNNEIRITYKCGHSLRERLEFESDEDKRKFQHFTLKHKNCPKCVKFRERFAAGEVVNENDIKEINHERKNYPITTKYKPTGN